MREEVEKLDVTEREKGASALMAIGNEPKSGTNWTLIICLLLALVGVGAGWAYMQKSSSDTSAAAGKAAMKERRVPVVVTTAVEKALPIELRSIGNVTPY